MNALINKTREASTEQLFEMAILLNNAIEISAIKVRTSVSVVLEERLSAEEFDLFFAGLDAA